MKRRSFITSSISGAALLTSAPLLSFRPPSKKLKISLAQWFLHRTFNKGQLDPRDFASLSSSRQKSVENHYKWVNAAQSNINIVIENHGLFSSDAKLITEIVDEVNMKAYLPPCPC